MGNEYKMQVLENVKGTDCLRDTNVDSNANMEMGLREQHMKIQKEYLVQGSYKYSYEHVSSVW
jgi:hypothetical protein